MRVFPYLTNREKTEKYMVQFRGLNYGEDAADGELQDCCNLSTEKYPCMTPRRERVREAGCTAPSTLYVKDGLLMVDGTDVFYQGETIGEVTAGRKQMATVGNYVVIFPDKVYFNTAEPEKGLQHMEAAHTEANLVFDNSTEASTITAAEGVTWPFRVGDAVEITGCEVSGNNKTPIVRGVEGNVLRFYANTLEKATEAGAVTLRRNVPDLEYICESNYRLWGVKGNTIMGSKYADPLNFFCYDGLSGDSFYVDVGSDGPFTGCIPYSGHICFFKENVLHKLYGSKPSNYQVITSHVYGVQEGCERSLCVVNEQLVYKGVNGVYAYAGGVPELITGKFGGRRYAEAAAACDGERYYISMHGAEGWRLFVYDVQRNLWLQEDDVQAVDMAVYGGEVYLLCADGLWRMDRNGGKNLDWYAVFCPFHEVMLERKGYSKFSLRVDLADGAQLSVDMMTDRDDAWRQVFATTNSKARTVCIPIIPTRCDSVRIRIRGRGDCTVKAFVREFSVGSDV